MVDINYSKMDFRYRGQILNNLFHGVGEYTWPNRDVYSGQYSLGRRNGIGEMRYRYLLVITIVVALLLASKWFFTTSFFTVLYRYADGDSYSGAWRSGKYHEQGTYR